MPERGTGPSPRKPSRDFRDPVPADDPFCPACGAQDYRMIFDNEVSDWVWEAVETSGDAYGCKACNAHWVNPDFEQTIRWERPDPE